MGLTAPLVHEAPVTPSPSSGASQGMSMAHPGIGRRAPALWALPASWWGWHTQPGRSSRPTTASWRCPSASSAAQASPAQSPCNAELHCLHVCTLPSSMSIHADRVQVYWAQTIGSYPRNCFMSCGTIRLCSLPWTEGDTFHPLYSPLPPPSTRILAFLSPLHKWSKG